MSRTVCGGWVLEKTIGTGGFGAVTLWKNEELDQCLALKKCRVSSEMTMKHKERWGKEIDIMLRLCHPNVVNAVKVPDELAAPPNELPCLGMEYCAGGDLRKVLSRPENCAGLAEHQARGLVHDVAAGIEYLHQMRIIHRDLKPENIVLQLVDEKTVYKIIDLGYAKDLEQGSVCTSFVGTLQYLAPELFSCQRYTCTVDYWSFGILVFEAITGFRPFLPNIMPLKWHQEVFKKENDDIYVYSNRRDETKYSKNIPSPNYLCRTSKMYLEQWLRQMLVWDPCTRGGGLAETLPRTGPVQKRPKCFTMLDNILEMKIVFILNVASGDVLSYPVKEAETLSSLQRVVEQETHTPVPEQELLLASGICPDPDKPAEQCWAEMGEEEWLVFLFRKNMTTYPAAARKVRAPPDLVALMLREPATLLPFQDQKSVWGHAVYFCSTVAKDYRRLLQGQRAAMMSLLRGNSSFSKLKTRLDTDFYRLQAQAEFFKDGLTYDITKYQDQTATGISSQKLTSKWKKMEEESAKFLSKKDEVLSLDQLCNVLSTRVVELQRSPFAKMKRIDVLEEVEKNARAEYDRLRQTSREQRHLVSDNMPMVQHVKRCQRDRERLTSELYLHLGKINQCKQELDGLSPKLDRLLEEIEVAKERLRLLQHQRQGDMWTLLKMTLRQKATSSQPSSIFKTQAGGSSEAEAAGGGADGQATTASLSSDPGTVSTLTSIVTRSNEESVAMVTENFDVKNKLLDLLGSLQDEHSRSMTELHSLDWSFMGEAGPGGAQPDPPLYLPASQPLYTYQSYPSASLPPGQPASHTDAPAGSAASLQLYQQPLYQPGPAAAEMQAQYVLTPIVGGSGVSPNAAAGPAFLAGQQVPAGNAGVASGMHHAPAVRRLGAASTAAEQHAALYQQLQNYPQILAHHLAGGAGGAPGATSSPPPVPGGYVVQGLNSAQLLGLQAYPLARPPGPCPTPQGIPATTQVFRTPVANGRTAVASFGGGFATVTTTPHISITAPTARRIPPKVPTRSTSTAGSNA